MRNEELGMVVAARQIRKRRKLYLLGDWDSRD